MLGCFDPACLSLLVLDSQKKKGTFFESLSSKMRTRNVSTTKVKFFGDRDVMRPSTFALGKQERVLRALNRSLALSAFLTIQHTLLATGVWAVWANSLPGFICAVCSRVCVLLR
jgi:hypothetical protein